MSKRKSNKSPKPKFAAVQITNNQYMPINIGLDAVVHLTFLAALESDDPKQVEAAYLEWSGQGIDIFTAKKNDGKKRFDLAKLQAHAMQHNALESHAALFILAGHNDMDSAVYMLRSLAFAWNANTTNGSDDLKTKVRRAVEIIIEGTNYSIPAEIWSSYEIEFGLWARHLKNQHEVLSEKVLIIQHIAPLASSDINTSRSVRI